MYQVCTYIHLFIIYIQVTQRSTNGPNESMYSHVCIISMFNYRYVYPNKFSLM